MLKTVWEEQSGHRSSVSAVPLKLELDLAVGLRKPPVNCFPGTPRHVVPTLSLLNNSEVSKLGMPRRQECVAHYLQRFQVHQSVNSALFI